MFAQIVLSENLFYFQRQQTMPQAAS